jgi:hypothetical protein
MPRTYDLTPDVRTIIEDAVRAGQPTGDRIGVPSCGARTRYAEGLSYLCTLPKGHAGAVHIAHGFMGAICHAWKDGAP